MEKEDRISELPDSIIHHILTFLPSTKQAIRTSILSKRWHKQWTHLPVLIFDLSGKRPSDEHISSICTSMDYTLFFHECSKMKTFHIHSDWYTFALDPNYISKLRFPIIKEVEELRLGFDWADHENNKLPNFFFNNASLIKLNLNSCNLIPNGCVNWEHLKDLYIDCCRFSNQAIQGVVSGSPLLESLEIHYCQGFDLLAIASKTLKNLVLEDLKERFFLEVSCPNLVYFYALTHGLIGGYLSGSSDEAIDVLCVNTINELLEVNNSDGFTYLIVDSDSLKRLVLSDTGVTDAVVVSCPNLEDLSLSSLPIEAIKLVNVPSSVCATLGYHCNYCTDYDLVRMVLEELHHVKDLNIACCFIKILSVWQMKGVSSPSINSKCLTLDCGYQFAEILPGISHALRTSPDLEKLVINLGWLACRCGSLVSEENYWGSKVAVFNFVVFHLKIVEVFYLSEKHEEELEAVLNFVEYLLKNARVLEKMVIKLEDSGSDFVFEVSQRLSSVSRFSQHAIVDVEPPKRYWNW